MKYTILKALYIISFFVYLMVLGSAISSTRYVPHFGLITYVNISFRYYHLRLILHHNLICTKRLVSSKITTIAALQGYQSCLRGAGIAVANLEGPEGAVSLRLFRCWIG